jgi:para-aminobenzoate synthetase/4-amino-4-deoxychorismate lyase
LALGFVFDAKKVMELLKTNSKQYSDGHWRMRLLLSANGKAEIEVLELSSISHSPQFVMANDHVASDNPCLRHKTTRREIYTALMSNEPEIFDTLLYNERGELTEFTRGNLVIELEGKLITPATSCGLLPGVFRDTLISRKRVHEAIVTKVNLMNANRIWFINSVRGAIEVKISPKSTSVI